MLNEILKEKKLTMYRLSQLSEVPYSTINDICAEKTSLEKCSAETVYRIAKALDVPMEDLLSPYMIPRSSFENFKSTICHRVKEMGDIDFIINTLEGQEILVLYRRKWYPESLYLLAMLDYLSRENNVPLCNDYDFLRKCRLEKPVYPAGLRAIAAAAKNENILKEAEKTSIPEFMRFNIIENEVRNVV